MVFSIFSLNDAIFLLETFFPIVKFNSLHFTNAYWYRKYAPLSGKMGKMIWLVGFFDFLAKVQMLYPRTYTLQTRNSMRILNLPPFSLYLIQKRGKVGKTSDWLWGVWWGPPSPHHHSNIRYHLRHIVLNSFDDLTIIGAFFGELVLIGYESEVEKIPLSPSSLQNSLYFKTYLYRILLNYFCHF